MKCPHCGAQLHEDAQFCLYCMHSLRNKPELSALRAKKTRWLIILPIVLALLALGFFLFSEKNGEDPAQMHKTSHGNTPTEAPQKPTKSSEAEQQDTQASEPPPSETNQAQPQATEPTPAEPKPTQPQSTQPTPTQANPTPTETPPTQPPATESEPMPPQTTPSPSTEPTQITCSHVYTPATCIAPMTCTLCGDTYGTVSDSAHDWENITAAVEHAEVGHYEEVQDAKKVQKYRCWLCSYAQPTFATLSEYYAHFDSAHADEANSAFFRERYEIVEEWVYEMTPVWVVDQAAYTETIITGRRCKLCTTTQQ